MASKNIGEESRAVSKGLNAKDFVFIAVFGVLLFLVFMVFSIVFSMNASSSWFTHSVGAIPAGIVWMYLLYRVPKRGAIAIMGVIVAIVGLLMGMFWSGPVGIVVGAFIAELVLGDPKKRSTLKMCIAFAVFVFSFWLGQISLIIVGSQAYVEMCMSVGLSAEYGQTLVDFIYSPMAIVCGITTIIGALLGGFLGSKVFAKHFAKLNM
ncbi:MAG: MptD family putative ECF transporter S component [Eggerthellaceae bacterium]